MKLYTCTRRIQFCAGHRVMMHESKCAHLHGHNYVALFTASAEGLDDIGRVIDFGVLKLKLGGWIDKHWDHGFILYEKDNDALDLLEGFEPAKYRSKYNERRQKLYLLPANPTAENMADHLLRIVCPQQLADTGVVVTKVRLWETENCYADAES